MAQYICTNCGEGSASWIGKCPSCQEWNTFKVFKETPENRSKKIEPLSVKPLNKIKALETTRKSSGLSEFDRVLGGGIVAGEVLLLTGEPGIGKSTLLLQSLKNFKTLYISGEESAPQVKDRADRLKINLDNFNFSDTLQVESITNGVLEMKSKPEIVVIDSIQTIYSKELATIPGNVAQLRECTSKLIRVAKENSIPIIIVGHITKDGDIAGPKTLEHMVDAVLVFEGDKISNFRILRAQKNRFGSTDEIGIFEMIDIGLSEISSPQAFIDNQHQEIVPGKATIGAMEGKRPLFFEIQSLATPSFLPVPRRVIKGVDYNKVLLLVAVIEKHLKIPLLKYDIFVNVVGGVQIKSPSADLGVVASIISSVKNLPLKETCIFTGEDGLLGEIRKSAGQEKILKEIARLNNHTSYSSLNLKNVKNLIDLF